MISARPLANLSRSSSRGRRNARSAAQATSLFSLKQSFGFKTFFSLIQMIQETFQIKNLIANLPITFESVILSSASSLDSGSLQGPIMIHRKGVSSEDFCYVAVKFKALGSVSIFVQSPPLYVLVLCCRLAPPPSFPLRPCDPAKKSSLLLPRW